MYVCAYVCACVYQQNTCMCPKGDLYTLDKYASTVDLILNTGFRVHVRVHNTRSMFQQTFMQ